MAMIAHGRCAHSHSAGGAARAAAAHARQPPIRARRQGRSRRAPRQPGGRENEVLGCNHLFYRGAPHAKLPGVERGVPIVVAGATPCSPCVRTESRRPCCASAPARLGDGRLLLYTYTMCAVRSSHVAAARDAEQKGELLLGGALAPSRGLWPSPAGRARGLRGRNFNASWACGSGRFVAASSGQIPRRRRLRRGTKVGDHSELPAGLDVELPLGAARRAGARGPLWISRALADQQRAARLDPAQGGAQDEGRAGAGRTAPRRPPARRAGFVGLRPGCRRAGRSARVGEALDLLHDHPLRAGRRRLRRRRRRVGGDEVVAAAGFSTSAAVGLPPAPGASAARQLSPSDAMSARGPGRACRRRAAPAAEDGRRARGSWRALIVAVEGAEQQAPPHSAAALAASRCTW